MENFQWRSKAEWAGYGHLVNIHFLTCTLLKSISVI